MREERRGRIRVDVGVFLGLGLERRRSVSGLFGLVGKGMSL